MKLKYRNQKNAEVIAKYFGKALDKPDWYSVRALSEDQDEILVYDYIGWPYNDPYDLVQHLKAIKDKDVLVRINSPGGDVFDGLSIYNAFKEHGGNVTMRIEGLAASMASVIAMAGAETHAYKNSMIMIHNAWTCTCGNQFELAEYADLLAKIDSNLVEVYQDKSKSGKKDIAAMMKAETWMTAKEAKEKGFINTIIEPGKATQKAKFDLSIFSNVPDGMSGDSGSKPITIRDIEKFLRDGGVSNSKAKAILAGCKDIGGVDEGDIGTTDNKPDEDGKLKGEFIARANEINKIIQTIKGKV